MAWSNQPQLSAPSRRSSASWRPQLAAEGLRRVLPRRRGRLLRVLREIPVLRTGMRDEARDQLCGLDYYAETASPTPSGEFVNFPALRAKTIATIGNVGPTPVLLVFSDRDAAFPTADHRGIGPTSYRPRSRCGEMAVTARSRSTAEERRARRSLPQAQQEGDQPDPRLAPRPQPLTHAC